MQVSIQITNKTSNRPVNGPFMIDPNPATRSLEQWVPPEIDWIKINFDGAARGNSGQAGAGCVARDH